MEIAIAGGAGILLGVGLLIWGLKERKARHKAEIKMYSLQKSLDESWVIAKQNIQYATNLEAEKQRIASQLHVLKQRISDLETRLLSCNDPAAVKAMLSDRLKARKI